MDIVETRRVPGLAELHLVQAGPDPRRMIEFVDTLEPGVPKDRKWVLMVSTQAGCPIGCSLCDAGALGYWGNLSCEELLWQVRRCLEANPDLDPARHPKLKIHFARMGEPTLNPAVLEALRALPALAPGPGLLPSLSTVAPAAPQSAEFLERLCGLKDELYPGGRFQLQFSLHATDEASRARVIPVRTWPLERVAEYGRAFRKPGDRKVTLNFAPPPGARLDAEALSRLFDPATFLVKVTPVNPTGAADDSGHTHAWQAPPEGVAAFAEGARALGFEVIVSPSLPEEIEAATSCGQLWSEALKGQAQTRRRNLERDAGSYLAGGGLERKTEEWRLRVGPPRRNAPPREPALLIVDLQDFFMSPRSRAYLPAAKAVAANAVRLARAFREAGRPVAYTVHAYEDPEREGGPMLAWWSRACLAASPEARVARVLEPGPAEPILRKTRYSAFSNPGLEPWLRGAGAGSLVVCGVMTHLCVEATARAAFDLGFDVRLPMDACAADSEEHHLGSLVNAAHGFAVVQTTQEILQCLKSCSPASASP